MTGTLACEAIVCDTRLSTVSRNSVRVGLIIRACTYMHTIYTYTMVLQGMDNAFYRAVHIHLSAPGLRMNIDVGKEISRVWQELLKKLTSRNVHPRGHRTATQATPTNASSAPPTVASQNW